MNSNFLAPILLVLLVHADIVYSEVHYITPSPNGPCPQNSSCLTLSQFAATSSYNETDLLSLLFLPGNHTLNRDLLLAHVKSLSMTKYGLDNETVYVDCSNNSGRFDISETISVSINDLNFIGCGSNVVSQVKWLTITDCTFQNVHYRSTVLVLNGIHNATIVRSAFLSNLLFYPTAPFSYGYSGTYTCNVVIQVEQQILEYIKSHLSIPSGALYTSFSNVSIISCKFMHNRGGALAAYNSSLYLARSTYSNNTANIGSVMVTSGSTIYIDNNAFINNTAQYFGGVMATAESTIDIDNCIFANSTAKGSGGVMMVFKSTYTISRSTFTNNSVDKYFGGVMHTLHDSSIDIISSSFIGNRAWHGGVIAIDDSSFSISNSTFTNNNAVTCAGVISTKTDSFKISSSIFNNNRANHGGVMTVSGFSFIIDNSTFTNNRAYFGGVMGVYYVYSFNIRNSVFSNNTADGNGGVMDAEGVSSFNITDCTFTNNNATDSGGVMISFVSSSSSFNIGNSVFNNNRADSNGGVITASAAGGVFSFNITDCTFTNNNATGYGGVMRASFCSLTVSNCSFVKNKATQSGAVIWCSDRTVNVENSYFSLNAVVYQGGGVIFIRQTSTHITNSSFDRNIGSLYTFNSNLTFSGHLEFKNSTEPLIAGNAITSQEGGAITSFQSNVIFTGERCVVHFSNNRASHGGAILATESTITIYGETIIAENMATMTKSSGGGIALKQSRLEIEGRCYIVNNVAVKGGGIHSSSSTITVFRSGTLVITGNHGELGGGIYLVVNPKLYIRKNTGDYRTNYLMNFTGNHANYGGAMYVADDTNSGACSPDIECFIQALALYQSGGYNTMNIFFSENTASEQGPNLFGGLLDRCIPSPFAEVYLKETTQYSGVTYLGNISNIDADSVSSQPVRVCFCNSEQEPDCSYQPPTIRVEKGKAFNVSLVAVDQVHHTINASITSSLSSSDGGFDEGQQIQSVNRNCTDLTFNVFSPHVFETLNIHPDGPCGNAVLSTSNVTIQFIDCTCPVGFEPLSNSQSSTRCECICDSALSPYITECNITTSSVLRIDTNSWITYINDTDPPEYVIYPYCPFDYCLPPTENVSINFNFPNGADSQCAYNRTGVLCGACKEDLSLSLASSRCVPCHTHWPAVFIVILIAAAIAGIMLVISLLALNITVSVGLINSFIFYANIVSAGSAIFFSSSEPSFPSVFVAWLNLDIGIDVCFIDGLDSNAKTWLQLAFPVYIISLVVLVIVVSEYSPRFAGIIGKRDPVSTLATLVLLSYAKLLSITITALSSAVLDYPGGQVTVWLPDGNVPYFRRKHIPLVLVALMIIIIGLPYTLLLFLWQWIVRAPRWKVFKWTRNTKLNAFIASHHVPHNSKYRYWTGLLLLVRVVLYISASVTISANPQTLPLITNILIGGLILFKSVLGLRVYKNSFVNIVDSVLYFNLLVLSAFTLFDSKDDTTKQRAVAYTSTIITAILFIGAILYHVKLLIRNEKPPEDLNEYPLAPVKPTNAEVTHSVVEPPKRDDQDPPPADSKDSDEKEITEDRQIVTPPYKSQ